MKLSKKRISILVIICVTLIVSIFTLCSFSPPDFVPTTSIAFSSLSQIDVDNVRSIVNLQSSMGYFGAYFPVFCRMRSSGVLSLTCLKKGSTYTFTDAGSRWEFSTTGDVAVFEFTADGFSFSSTSSYNPADSELLFFRTSESLGFLINPDFQYSGSYYGDDNISDCLNYWIQFYENTINFDSSVESAYSDGYNDGLETGYWVGWDEGYETGYKSGYDYGLADGYVTGFGAGAVDGYVDGYADGFDNGYDSGYSEGLIDAPNETVTVYIEPVELDIPRIFNAIGAVPRQVLEGVDFQIFGVPILGVLLSILILTISIFVIRKIK